MSVSKLFVEIPEMQRRLLARLIEQKRADPYGAIGWRFPYTEWPEEAAGETVETLWGGLLGRRLVEDLSGVMGQPGVYFVRITALGEACAALGRMSIDGRAVSSATMKALAKEMEEQEPGTKEPEAQGSEVQTSA